MHLSLPKAAFKRYVRDQLAHFFPDGVDLEGNDVDAAFDLALDRAEFCFRHIAMRGYTVDGQANFSHLHSDQYCQFLYLLGNSLWQVSQNKPLCDKLTLLNRSLHGIFLSYKLNLPKIMHLEHAIGSVLGHANYSDFLVVLHNVTVNSQSPTIERGVMLGAGAMVLGNKTIGARSSIGANSVVFNRDIPPDSIVYTDADGAQIVQPRAKACGAQIFFNVEIP